MMAFVHRVQCRREDIGSMGNHKTARLTPLPLFACQPTA